MAGQVSFATFFELDLVPNGDIVSNPHEFEGGSKVRTSGGSLGGDVDNLRTSMLLSKEC
jgi:hypothetical protein